MAEFKAGDGVKIITREVTPEDVKSGLYFQYFGDLVGKVDRVYDDGSVCVDVDIDSLSEDARDRHMTMQEAERKRWLDGLSGEARNRLTEEQKQLKISYKILVSKKDLEPHKISDKPKGKQSKTAPKEPSEAPSQRLTEADLQAKEEEHLKSLQEKG